MSEIFILLIYTDMKNMLNSAKKHLAATAMAVWLVTSANALAQKAPDKWLQSVDQISATSKSFSDILARSHRTVGWGILIKNGNGWIAWNGTLILDNWIWFGWGAEVVPWESKTLNGVFSVKQDNWVVITWSVSGTDQDVGDYWHIKATRVVGDITFTEHQIRWILNPWVYARFDRTGNSSEWITSQYTEQLNGNTIKTTTYTHLVWKKWWAVWVFGEVSLGDGHKIWASLWVDWRDGSKPKAEWSLNYTYTNHGNSIQAEYRNYYGKPGYTVKGVQELVKWIFLVIQGDYMKKEWWINSTGSNKSATRVFAGINFVLGANPSSVTWDNNLFSNIVVNRTTSDRYSAKTAWQQLWYTTQTVIERSTAQSITPVPPTPPTTPEVPNQSIINYPTTLIDTVDRWPQTINNLPNVVNVQIESGGIEHGIEAHIVDGYVQYSGYLYAGTSINLITTQSWWERTKIKIIASTEE
jgi:hypothetical protein